MRVIIKWCEAITHKPIKPFLWRSEQGCVYLRNANKQDITVSPGEKVGCVTEIYTPDYEAWAKRLKDGEHVLMRND